MAYLDENICVDVHVHQVTTESLKPTPLTFGMKLYRQDVVNRNGEY